MIRLRWFPRATDINRMGCFRPPKAKRRLGVALTTGLSVPLNIVMPDPVDPTPPPPSPSPMPSDTPTSTGLPSNVAAALACIPLVGGLIFYILEKRDQFVRFYA